MERAIGPGIPVVLRVYDGRATSGVMDVRRIGPAVRLARAARALGICWAFGVIALLVPFLHWVLVPTLALLGPVVAVRAFANGRQVRGGGGPCPACGVAMSFSRSATPDAFRQTCATCRMSVEVVPALRGPLADQPGVAGSPGPGR